MIPEDHMIAPNATEVILKFVDKIDQYQTIGKHSKAENIGMFLEMDCIFPVNMP